MIDEFAKEYLHRDLRDTRATMLWKLEGLAEYDVRRPLTPTGTNLLGLIKHLTITEAWYFGEVFGRPCPERLPWRDDDADERADDDKLVALFEHKLELAEMWARLCPAQVYEVGEPAGDGTVEVKLAPSNCVQCGAITAKGGRLTPPEGGSGPEYMLT